MNRITAWIKLRSDPDWRRGRSGRSSGRPDDWPPNEWKGWLARQRAAVRWDAWDLNRDYDRDYKPGQSISKRKLCWCPAYSGRAWSEDSGKYLCEVCRGETFQG